MQINDNGDWLEITPETLFEQNIFIFNYLEGPQDIECEIKCCRAMAYDEVGAYWMRIRKRSKPKAKKRKR